jgi:hypothetical protein
MRHGDVPTSFVEDAMSETGGPGPYLPDSAGAIACSFCGKAKSEVAMLIAGKDGLHLR